MTVAATGPRRSGGGYLERPAPSSLGDVIDSILDKGLVIDAYVRVSLVGIELLTIDARIVIASVDTYLRFAEATNRLDLYEKGGKDIPQITEGVMEAGASGVAHGVVSGTKEILFGSDSGREDEEPEYEEPRPRRRRPQRTPARRRTAEE